MENKMTETKTKTKTTPKNKKACKLMVTGSGGSGKEQPLTSKVHTPNGFVQMGDLTVGQVISHPLNKPNRVIKIFPQGVKDVYEVKFTDGSIVECGLNHLWSVHLINHDCKHEATEDNPTYHTKTISLKDMITLQNKGDTLKIPLQKAIITNGEPLSNNHIDPYTLGVFIAGSLYNDAMTALSYYEDDFDYICNTIKIAYGLKKHSKDRSIPQIYLDACLEDRIALLRGLMDCDGSVDERNRISYSTNSLQLVKDIKELVESLGGIVGKPYEDTKQDNVNYTFSVQFEDFNPFSLPSKANKVTPRTGNKLYRTIESIELTDRKVEQQCILVSADDHLYLTDNMITTHNTRLLSDLKESLVVYADTKKEFPLQMMHTNIYEYKTFNKKEIPRGAYEYSGMQGLIKHIMQKLSAYKKLKGKLPESVAFDAVTNIYAFVNHHIKATTKNVYGSQAVDIEKEMSLFLSFVERELIPRGIDVIFLSHTVTMQNGEDLEVKISTTGSKTFEATGGLFATFNEVIYLNTTNDIKIVNSRNPQYPNVCRSMLSEVPDFELYDDFSITDRLEAIRSNMSDNAEFLI